MAALAQLILVSFYYPATELLSDIPLYYNNASYHLYQMKFARLLAELGLITGYDPTFGAGHIGGVAPNGSAKLISAIGILLQSWTDEIVLYKIYVFAADLTAPLFMILAARLFGLSNRTLVIVSIFVLLLWWVSWIRWIFSTGMVASAWNTCVAFAYLALIVKYLEGWGSKAVLIGLGLLGAILFLVHPHYVVVVAFGTASFIVFNFRDIDRTRVFLLLLVVPAISLGPNVPWLIEMIRVGRVEQGTRWPYLNAVDISLLWREAVGLYGNGSAGSKIYPVILLGLSFALFLAREEREKRIAYAFATAGFGMLLFAYVGAAIPGFKIAETNRHAPAGYLFFAIPAAIGMLRMFEIAANAPGRIFRTGTRICLMAVAITTSYTVWELLVEVSSANRGHYGITPPQIAVLSPEKPAILDWLKKSTTNEGRILFETTNVDKDSSLTAYLSLFVDRQFVGGPLASKHFANFYDSELFGRQIDDISSDELQRYIELYNIGWIIAFRAKTKDFLETIPQLEPVHSFGEYVMYDVKRDLSFFETGVGTLVQAGPNHLQFDDVEGSHVVLRFHYVPGLASDPPLVLQPAHRLDDPVPFIAIDSPPKQFRLYLP